MEQGSHSAIGKNKYHLLATPSRSCRQDELGGQKRIPNGRPISEMCKVTNATFRQCRGLATLQKFQKPDKKIEILHGARVAFGHW